MRHNTFLIRSYPPEWGCPPISPNTNGGHMATNKGPRQRFGGCSSPGYSHDGLAGPLLQPGQPDRPRKNPGALPVQPQQRQATQTPPPGEKRHHGKRRAQLRHRGQVWPAAQHVLALACALNANKTTGCNPKAKRNYRRLEEAPRRVALKVATQHHHAAPRSPLTCHPVHS